MDHATQLVKVDYRVPEGRPRAIPPCDVTAPVSRETTAPADGRPVRKPGEPRGRYAALVGHWMDRQDPARKAARIKKGVATQRKRFLKKQRRAAAAAAVETKTERWHRPLDISLITGWSSTQVGRLTQNWPQRVRFKGASKYSRRGIEVFGDVSTLPVKSAYRIVTRQEPKPKPAPVLILAPPVAKQIASPRRSLWQRVMGWFA